MQFKVEINNYQPAVRGAFFDLGEQKQWRVLSLGIGSYLVQASLDYGGLRDSTLIGRYCSLARDLNLLVGVNHAPQYVSTYPFRELDWRQDPWNPNHYPEAGGHQILIGNDVWIGFDVTILGGVRIGNGAVIGAGAVVARDVPPYAVVVGNPARVIRYRFTEDVIAKLQKIKWWNWPYEEILRNQALLEDVDAFVARYYQESMAEPVQTELAKELQRLHSAGWCIGYFVPDFAAPKPVWEQVVRQYLSRYQAADRIALLLEVPVEEQQSEELQRLQAMVTAAGEQAPMILRHVDPVFPAVDVLQHIDFYITSREEVSLRCVDFADEYGFQVLYALDIDFWKAVSYDCKN